MMIDLPVQFSMSDQTLPLRFETVEMVDKTKPASVSIQKTGNRIVEVGYISAGALKSKSVTTTTAYLEGLGVGDVLMIYFYGSRSGTNSSLPAVSCNISISGGSQFLIVNKSYFTGSGSYPVANYYKVYLIQITSENAEIIISTT